MSASDTFSGKIVLVTGANRGIGAATVRELLKTKAAKIYATARKTASLPDFGDARVHAIALDITDEASIKAAHAQTADTDILINNAGTATFGDLLDASVETVTKDFGTNIFGTLNVIRTFAPGFKTKRAGTIVNVLSVVGLTAAPGLPGYSASKAALQSLTQSFRATLKPFGVTVLGVYPGPIDTDMAKDLPWDKATPEHAAQKIVAGIQAGETHIFPDPLSEQVAHLWRTDGLALDSVLAERAEDAAEAA